MVKKIIHLHIEEAQEKITKIEEQLKAEEVKSNKTKRKRLYH
jgi:hypothetical protein